MHPLYMPYSYTYTIDCPLLSIAIRHIFSLALYVQKLYHKKGVKMMLRVRELREAKGIQQKELAIDLSVSQPTISDWESGRKVPSARSTQKLADYFGVSVDYLLGREIADKTPVPKGERLIRDEDIRAAFFGGADDLSEEEMSAMWNDAKDYIQYKLEQRRRKKNGGPD